MGDGDAPLCDVTRLSAPRGLSATAMISGNPFIPGSRAGKEGGARYACEFWTHRWQHVLSENMCWKQGEMTLLSASFVQIFGCAIPEASTTGA